MILLDRVTKTYKKGVHPALSKVSLHIAPREFAIIVGASGAGKSTLLKMLTREEKPDSGKIVVGGIDYDTLDDRDIPLLRRKIDVVFQDFKLLKNRTVYENVAYVLEVTGASHKHINDRVLEVLRIVELVHKADHYPHECSGGEQQRVAIARALVNNPEIILAAFCSP